MPLSGRPLRSSRAVDRFDVLGVRVPAQRINEPLDDCRGRCRTAPLCGTIARSLSAPGLGHEAERPGPAPGQPRRPCVVSNCRAGAEAPTRIELGQRAFLLRSDPDVTSCGDRYLELLCLPAAPGSKALSTKSPHTVPNDTWCRHFL